MKVQLSPLIQSISGTIGDFVYFTRNGKTYAKHKNTTHSPQPTPYTPHPTAHSPQQQRFAQTTHIVKEIMATQHLLAHYQQLFLRQHRYQTLRGYIFAQVYESAL